jgi:hypothetical protein
MTAPTRSGFAPAIVTTFIAIAATSPIRANPMDEQQAAPAPASVAVEVIYPRRSREVWMAANRLLSELRLTADRRDDRAQIVVSRRARLQAPDFPTPVSLGVGANQVVTDVQLHVYVAPHMQPARVAIGSIVTADPQAPTTPQDRRLSTKIYNPAALNQWFVAKLTLQQARSRKCYRAKTPRALTNRVASCLKASSTNVPSARSTGWPACPISRRRGRSSIS